VISSADVDFLFCYVLEFYDIFFINPVPHRWKYTPAADMMY